MLYYIHTHAFMYTCRHTHDTRWAARAVQGLLAQRRGEAPETSAQSTLLCLGEHPKTTLVFGTF